MRLGAETTERRKGQVHSTLVQFLLRASSQPDLHADNEAWRKGKQTNARRTKLRSEQDSSGRKGWDVAKRFFNEWHFYTPFRDILVVRLQGYVVSLIYEFLKNLSWYQHILALGTGHWCFDTSSVHFVSLLRVMFLKPFRYFKK